MDKIKIICPSCRGVGRPLVPHSACNGTGKINGQSDPKCSGTGLILNSTCGTCNGKLYVNFGKLSNDLINFLSDLREQLDNTKTKCDEIMDKLNE